MEDATGQNCSADLLSERYNGKEGHLEMLQAERYAYYGDTADKPEGEMDCRDLKAEDKDPDHVHYNGQAASVIRVRHDVIPERPKGEFAHLEQLQAERYADDRDAEQQPCEEIAQRDQQSSEHKP